MASCEEGRNAEPNVYFIVNKIRLGRVNVPLEARLLKEGESVDWRDGPRIEVARREKDGLLVGTSDDGYSFKVDRLVPTEEIAKDPTTRGRFFRKEKED